MYLLKKHSFFECLLLATDAFLSLYRQRQMRIDRRGFANTAAAADGMTCMQCVYMHRIKRLSGIKEI